MMDQVKKYILSQVAKQQLSKEEAKELLLELTSSEVSVEKDVAIIGMAGRFPKSNDPETFWKLLRDGVNCVQPYPKARLRDFEPILRNPHYAEYLLGKPVRDEDIPLVHSRGGYLEEIDKFDASFFGIPPAEALYMDPHQRIALEVAYEAMEDAGYGGNALIGSRTGVYIGRDNTNYSYYRLNSEKDRMQLTGSWESLMVSRISYLFDFKAPCMVVDTACSAGLVSVHMAAQAMAAGDCDLAIAGGINISVTGDLNPRFQEGANMGDVESEEGIIRTFDARANGTVWGEGVGLVVLKPLRKAIEDGDHIRAVIKASAINNDGASANLTAPSAETQETVIVDTWQKAEIPPESISYIEVHGTGTVLGDPIEVKGLTNSFRRFTSRKQFCAVGSLKTNMGHMVGAAGIASLIKVIKSIEHKELAPTINFQQPNPYINFSESPLYVNDTLRPWKSEEGPLRAALSSFGFSRTNCHMVVEEPPVLEVSPANHPRYCLTFSAKNAEVMQDYLNKYASYVTEDSWNLADLCYTSNIGRGHYEHRIVVVAETKEELRRLVQGLTNKGTNTSGMNGVYKGNHRVVSEKKKELEDGEISKHDIKKLTREASDKLQAYLDGEMKDKSFLDEVCSLYVQGAEVDWAIFYRGESRRRIPIPTYPLKRQRFWAEPKLSKITTQRREALHPLVEQELSTPTGEISYETILTIDRHWVLADHRIGSKAVLPGTSYLEMVRFAAARAFGQDSMEFSNVFFLVPLMVEDGEEATVRLTLTKAKASSTWAFSVTSLDGSGEWIPHVEGKVTGLSTEAAEASVDLESIKSRADAVQDPYVEDTDDTGVFQFGPHWDTVRAVWQIGEFETLAKLQLVEHLQSELEVFQLHPSVLDNAVNHTSQNTGATFLPFMYKSFRLYGPMTTELYTHIRLQEDKGGKGETMTYDVDLLDSTGRVIAQIRDYTVKRMNDLALLESGNDAGACLQLNWIPRDKPTEASTPLVAGPWALLATAGTRAKELENALTSSGIEVVPFYLDSTIEQATGHSYTPDAQGMEAVVTDVEAKGIQGILFATDYTMEDTERDQVITSDHVFADRRKLGVDALFQLCKALLSRKVKVTGGMKVLVRDAWAVDGSEAGLSPLSAATAALARVIGQEYRHLAVDVLEVSGSIPVSDVVKESFYIESKGYRAIRPAGVFVEEMRSHRLPLIHKFDLDTEGAYVVSGGLGGLGLAIAERLADKGKANVILLGRSPLAAPEEWQELAGNGSTKAALYQRLVELQSKLGSLAYMAVDVADRVAMQQLHETITSRYGYTAGIFHAAGVAGEGFLMAKEDARFHEVLAPKLDGSMQLLRLLAQDGKGFMVLFSSIAAITGGEGQGDYSAANAFLDALADAGQKTGYKVISVNWPSWKEVGMSVDFHVDQEENLFHPLDVAEGLDWLEALIVEPQRRLVPGSFNTKVAAQLIDDIPFRLAPELTSSMSSSGESGSGNVGEVDITIKGAADPTSTQRTLSSIFARVLGLNEIDIFASFQDMGGNSLMATQLLKLIDEQFPGAVDISDLFSYPSVNDLSEFIDTQLGITHAEEPSNAQEDDVDSELRSLIQEELEGTEFLDLFMDQINGRGNNDR